MDTNQASAFYKRSLRPLLFMLDPEFAHGLSYSGLKFLNFLAESNLVPQTASKRDLSQVVFNRKFESPIGLAAGFDKNARLLENIGCLGFGFLEVGSITAGASLGNPKPRLFRLEEDEAVINFMGLNGEGAEAVTSRLKQSKPVVPYGLNIAKTNDATICGDKAVEDILTSFKCALKVDAAYIAINVSCPNTREDIREVGQQLGDIVEEIEKANEKDIPVLLKLSPDSDDRLLEEVFSVSSNSKISGFICGNTSITRDNLTTSEDRIASIGRGGLSGRPIKPLALRLVQKANELKKKEQIIIGCGGISNGQDAFEFICAGATLVEIYTALIFEGPFAPLIIAGELSEILDKNDLLLRDAIGSKISVKF